MPPRYPASATAAGIRTDTAAERKWPSRTAVNQSTGCSRHANGSAATLAVNKSACTATEARAKIRDGKATSMTPCTASRVKNAQPLPAAIAAKMWAAFQANECACQREAITPANKTAGRAFSATTHATKATSSAANFAPKICRGLTGSDASASQSRRLGKSDCHCSAATSAVMQIASEINQEASVRTRYRYCAA